MSQASDADLPDVSALNLNALDPRFHSEAAASLARAYEEDHSVDNARLEFRTLIMAYNAPLDDSRAAVSKFLMSQVDVSGPAGKILQSATAVWKRWGELATSLSNDNSNLALDAQTYCVSNEAYKPYFGVILRGMYESDTLVEDDLVEWRSTSTARGEGAKADEAAAWQEVYAKGKAYVDVLEQMDSESEEDESEEEEEESDDE